MSKFITVDFNEEEVDKAFNKLTDIEKDIITICETCSMIVVTEAKRIITEKGHIVTGNLRRSIIGVVESIAIDIILGKIGSHLNYAYYVERLPDGGYLFEALENKFDNLVKCLSNKIAERIV